MNLIILNASTDAPRMNALLRSIINNFEQTFPQRIRACYVLGSYADRTAVPLSDLDCFVIFKNGFKDLAEHERARQVSQQCAQASSIRLDVTAYPEASLYTINSVLQVALKLGSLLVYGEDIRSGLPLPSMSTYIQDLTRGALSFIALLRGQKTFELRAVDYPEPVHEFFGYTHVRIPEWYPPNHSAGTKELVATVSRVAATRVAVQASQYVPGKFQAIRLYQELIGGRWGSFVETVYDVCKRKWLFLLPERPSERAQLRALCAQMLAFENEFLQMISN